MAGNKSKISIYKYPLAEHIIMQDYGWDTSISKPRKSRSRAGNTADADLEAAFEHWRRKLARLVDSLLFNILMIVVVLIDVGCVVFIEFFADAGEKDCFERYTRDESIIYVLVLLFFIIELFMRVLSQGISSYFALRKKALWNWFDTAVVVVACFFSIVKLIQDYRFQINCPSVGLCPRERDHNEGSFSESCLPSGKCPYTPSSPYSTVVDQQLQASYQLCLNSGSSGKTEQIVANTAAGSRLISRAIILARIFVAVISTLKNEQSRFLYLHEVRVNISRMYTSWHGIRRYKILDYDLDLSYITDRLIAFAAPSSINTYIIDDERRFIGLNSAEMTSRFLGEHHYGQIKVYNLCAESIGNYSPHLFFSTVSRIPLARTSDVPSLSDILVYCDNMARFLRSDTNAVVAMHCSDGCRRTGVLCASWLLYCGHRTTARSAIHLFAKQRYILDAHATEDTPSQILGPSQVRAVEYLEQILKQGLPLAPVGIKAFSRMLEPEIEIQGLSVVNGMNQALCFRIFSQGYAVFDSDDNTAQTSGSSTDFHFHPVVVRGEVRITFYNPQKSRDRSQVFFLTFHTGFVHGPSHVLSQDKIVFGKNEIDGVHRDTTNKMLDKDFQVMVHVKLSADMFVRADCSQKLKDSLREQAKGQERLFYKGQIIIESGHRDRHLYLIVDGIVLQEVDDKDTEVGVGKTNVGMLFPGDFFGAEGFYSRLRQIRHVAATDSVQVIVVSRTASQNSLTCSPLALYGGVASSQESTSMWTAINRSFGPKHEKYSFPRLPEFDRAMAEILCREYHIKKNKWNQRKGFQLVEAASVSFQEKLRQEVIKSCRIPDSEFFLSAHICDVRVKGKLLVSGRVIIMTHYIIFDKKTSITTSYMSGKPTVFNVLSLSEAYRAGMQLKMVVAVLDKVEYELNCKGPLDAENLCTAFNAFLSDPHISFERSMAIRRSVCASKHRGEVRTNPDVDDNSLPPTPNVSSQARFLDSYSSHSFVHENDATHVADIFQQGEKHAYSGGEIVIEEGVAMTSFYRIVKGSVVVQSGGRTKEIICAGGLFGDVEYLLGRPKALARYSAETENGCILASIAISAVHGSGAQTKMAGRLYSELARKFAELKHSQLLHVLPHAFDSSKKRPTVALDDQADADEDAGGVAQHRVDRFRLQKMLRLRRCGLLRPLKGDALDQIAAQSKLISLAEGEALMKQGEQLVPGVSDCMYVLLSGVMRVFVRAPAVRGRRRLSNGNIVDESELKRIDTIACGDVVGEAAVLGGSRTRSATVVAASPCKVAQLSRSLVEGVILANPAVEGLFRDVMKQRMSNRLLQRMKVVTDHIDGAVSKVNLQGDTISTAVESTLFLNAGESLMQSGDNIVPGISDFLYILVSGTMQVLVHEPLSNVNGNGELLEVALISSGALIGEIGLLTGRPRSATVLATTECQIKAVRSQIILKQLSSDELRESLLQIADERMRSNLESRMRSVGRAIANLAAPNEQRTIRLRAGDVLMRQGEGIQAGKSDGLFVLLTGTMEVLMHDAASGHTGMPRMVDVIHAGAIIGEGELISGLPRAATVGAIIDCELVEISRGALADHFKPGRLLRRSLEAIDEQRSLLRSFSAAFSKGSDSLAAAAAAATAVAEAKAEQKTLLTKQTAKRALKRTPRTTKIMQMLGREDVVSSPLASPAELHADGSHISPRSPSELPPSHQLPSLSPRTQADLEKSPRMLALTASVVFESSSARNNTFSNVINESAA